MQKVCFKCGETVERRDCHKNRFGEYICRSCQAGGVKASWYRPLSKIVKMMFRQILLWLAGAAVIALFVWMFIGFLAGMDS
jgi:hypothetical protein